MVPVFDSEACSRYIAGCQECIALLRRYVMRLVEVLQILLRRRHRLFVNSQILQQAFQLYSTAAAQGFAKAQANMGRCYEEGIGVARR